MNKIIHFLKTYPHTRLNTYHDNPFQQKEITPDDPEWDRIMKIFGYSDSDIEIMREISNRWRGR